MQKELEKLKEENERLRQLLEYIKKDLEEEIIPIPGIDQST